MSLALSLALSLIRLRVSSASTPQQRCWTRRGTAGPCGSRWVTAQRSATPASSTYAGRTRCAPPHPHTPSRTLSHPPMPSHPSQVTAAKFLEYVVTGKPLLVKRGAALLGEWFVSERWAAEPLAARAGGAVVEAADVPGGGAPPATMPYLAPACNPPCALSHTHTHTRTPSHTRSLTHGPHPTLQARLPRRRGWVTSWAAESRARARPSRR